MKNLSLILSIVALIACGVLFYLHFKTGKTGTPQIITTKSGGDSLSGGGISLVYVNIDSLMAKYEHVKKIKSELEQKRKSSEGQFAAKADAFEKEYRQYQEKGPSMTQEQAQQTEALLTQKQQTLVQMKEELSQKLSENELKENQIIQKNISEFLHKYNETHNYTFILATGNGGSILLGDENLDITNEVVDGLNKEYKQIKN